MMMPEISAVKPQSFGEWHLPVQMPELKPQFSWVPPHDRLLPKSMARSFCLEKSITKAQDKTKTDWFGIWFICSCIGNNNPN